MRLPDEDLSPDDPPSPLGDGFGVTEDDLTAGFGDDDFADDAHASVGDFDATDDHDIDHTTPFGEGHGDDGAENVLVEILDDVFGDDAPDVVAELEASTGMDADELVDALSGGPAPYAQDELSPDYQALNGLDGGDEPFDDTDLPTKDDFDLTHDGHVDHHDLHEALHPFDFHSG
jgi:hypothetical protein